MNAGKNSRGQLYKNLWGRISFRLIILTVIVFVPVLLILIIYNVQNNSNARASMIAESRNDLQVAVGQLDNNFEVAEALLRTINNESSLLDSIRYYRNDGDTKKEVEYRQATALLAQHLSDALSIADALKYAFIYFPEQDLFYNSGLKKEMTDYIYDLMDTESLTQYKTTWRPVCLKENEWYLLRIWQYNGYMIGAWFVADDLLETIHISISEADRLLISDNYGNSLNSYGDYECFEPYQCGDVVSLSAEEKNNGQTCCDRFYYLYEQSDKAPVRLVKLLSTKTVALNSAGMMIAIVCTFTAFLILVLLFIICIRRWILMPLGRRMDAMVLIRSGDLSKRMPAESGDCTEFYSMSMLFNEMMDHVNQLKNEIYDGRIERQKIRLEYLQKQIQPHFILNTLNTLYNHTEDEVQRDIILLMTQYYRFVVNADSKYVLLGQELDHIRNYLNLQKVRYPSAFEYEIYCDNALEIVPVPPFLIESFVGNSIKHALNFIDCVHIRIEAVQIDTFNIRIRISDTGEGFDEEVIEMIQDYLSDRTIHEELGTGIRNSIERLRLIYGKKAGFRVYNNEMGGAVVEIDLALQMP